MEVDENPERGISYLQQFSCGVGHVINDVTRRLLQSFRMIFLMRVVGISATNAGLITLYSLFVGALIFAPVAGFLCDKVKIPVLSRRLGKKKSWHLFGTIAATIGVPLFFSQCLVCGSGTSEWVVLLYYFSIATVISFSINFVDISHLSIIPVLAKDQSEAAKLTALRTGFMYSTGIVSYLVAWLILGRDSRDQLTKESSMNFMVITLILTGVGLICSAIFHFGTKEPSDDSAENRRSRSTADYMVNFGNVAINTIQRKENGRGVMENGQQKSELYNQGHKLTSGLDNQGFDSKETQLNQHSQDVSQDEGRAMPSVVSDTESAQPPKRKAVRTWLKDPHLYKVAIIYACTKGSQDVFYAYLPLLLTDKLKFEKEAIANLPLILLVSATLSSQISRKLSGKVGKKWSFIVAALTVTGSCLWFLCINQSSRVFTYPAVVLLGFGSSAMFVNALGFATELIGDNKGSSGFVISVVGTTSNLTSGTLYVVIQVLFPRGSASADCQECGSYVQNVFSFVPSSLATFSLLLVMIFQVHLTVCGKEGKMQLFG
ncbi:unnamed protein product [Pocillopora meandrina]|uniref:Major facilitator superfamily domain-containing protein 12-like n=1 Tax=Pocillopora meandrina TaxID=46732 RepID=A0AAU9XTX7_9CNID|nr:unnamed protein product [Pocillopora meandrina]